MRALLARRPYAAIGAILTLMAVALAWEAQHLGMTVDEPSHVAAAYAYWLGEDILIPQDTPPLTRLTSGWVPRLLGAPRPRDTKGWSEKDAYLIGAEILGWQNPRGRRILRLTRLTFIIYPLLMVFVVWHWSRQLFGEAIALALAACTALEPTVLGHGALVKSDVAAATAAVWFAYTAWSYWREPRLGTLLRMALAVTVGVLTKFTLLPLIAIGWVLGMMRGPRWAAVATVPLAVYAGVLAASPFDVQPVPAPEVNSFEAAGVPGWAMPAARVIAKLPWPLQFIRGLLFIGVMLRGEGWTGYLLGQKVTGWAPEYFPVAWLVKYPIPLQALAAAGVAALAVRLGRREAGFADAAIWGSAALYFGAGVMSVFHIGFRHVLPAVPFLILGGGYALARWGGGRVGRVAALGGLAYLAASSAAVYPNGISYFNEWVGGAANGWKYLADSNLDWGQNLPELGVYVRENRVRALRTFVWSPDAMERYLPAGIIERQSWPDETARPGERFRPAAGTYAISVNLLTGLLYPSGYEDYLAYFRGREPDGRAGYSIMIYRVK